MHKDQLFAKIEASKREMSDAESVLEKVLSEISVVSRAEKTTISKAIEDAFAKLKAARKTLLDLETMLTNDDD